jgi:amino acid transporter
MPPPPPSTTPSSATTGKSSMSVTAAAALGVGGMMGAGLYTLVGLAATTAGVWIPVAFVIGGFVATLSVYSYAKLGAVFPSRGGAAQFLVRCFGDGVVAGGLNAFQFLGWIVAMALYAAGFAGYARELLPWETPIWVGKVIGVGIVLVVVVVNLVGSKLVGRSEQVVIVVEIVILALFVVLGLFKADVGHFSASGGDGVVGVLFAAGVLYICYEGFGVVTNSAGEMADPARELPRAMYLAVGIVVAVYVIVSATIVMVLTLPQIEANAGHVLADAAKEVAGRAGFIALGVAALLATSSAVNATMFGTANLAFMVAKDGELPASFDRKVWLGGTGRCSPPRR